MAKTVWTCASVRMGQRVISLLDIATVQLATSVASVILVSPFYRKN